MLLLCGGVSMGEFDLVEGVLAGLGCAAVFDGVAVQPGKPLVFAVHPGGIVFGLPGNPASVMVSFWLFVRPALRRLMGFEDSWWGPALTGTLAAPLPAAGPRDRFLPAVVPRECFSPAGNPSIAGSSTTPQSRPLPQYAVLRSSILKISIFWGKSAWSATPGT